MQILKRAPFMEPALCGDVCDMGFAFILKKSYMYASAIYVYLSSPFLCLSVPRYTKKTAGFVVASSKALVLRVGPWAGLSQVLNAIVSLNAVDMVKHSWRMNAVGIKPCKSVCGMYKRIDANNYIAAMVNVPSMPTFNNSTTCNSSPRKHASFWRVIKQIMQALRCKIGLSHEAVLSLIGQRPVSVCALHPASPL